MISKHSMTQDDPPLRLSKPEQYTLTLTAPEVTQLWILCQLAGGSDHREWMVDAGAKPETIRTFDSVMKAVENLREEVRLT